MRKIAFLDRDGTLIFEPTTNWQIDSLDLLEILPGVINGLQKLIQQGYELVLVTNQDGLGTNSFPQTSFDLVQNELIKIFKNNQIEFKEIFVCPHFLTDNCNCRKPKTGLLDQWLLENTIDKNNSFMLGDRDTDIEFAYNLGIMGFKMLTNTAFPRLGETSRYTSETKIKVQCNLDGQGLYNINTGIGFFDHMLEQLAKHSLIDLFIFAQGDLHIDEHHTVEDTAISLGMALTNALQARRGIRRFSTLLPMDEALVDTSIDLGGRSYLVFNAKFNRPTIGNFPTELVEHFFRSLSESLKANIHINVRYGQNEHHIIEAIFKSFAKSLRFAIELDPRLDNILPSTKGVL